MIVSKHVEVVIICEMNVCLLIAVQNYKRFMVQGIKIINVLSVFSKNPQI